MFKVQRALISVSDKRGLVAFAQVLHELGIELVSTGGTCRQIRDAGIPAVEVSEKTGFPEIMSGRVKTLHPVVHGGLLGRRGEDDAVMAEHGIEPIELLVVNLYPFEETISRPDVAVEDAIENIDIGGPAMIRAASKNHQHVCVVVDPDEYDTILMALRDDAVSLAMRRTLAAKAYAHTASYDTAISGYLSNPGRVDGLGERFLYSGGRISALRYGENPHQEAAFYRDQTPEDGSLANARQLQGKEPSYNNIADSDAALECVRQFSEPACVIVKHANPCGVAVDTTLLDAYNRAFSTDPTSAFGGIIAFNATVDAPLAHAIIDRQFVEVIVAPEFDDGALAALATKKNVRVLRTGPKRPVTRMRFDFRKVSGGLLVQTADNGTVAHSDLDVVSKKPPNNRQLSDMQFAWRVVKYVKSNAIVFCRHGMTIGIGAGQMSRIYSTRIAAIKAADEGFEVSGSVLASDAFFPFRDGIDAAAEYGVTAIIQPGGSLRDDEVIAAANEHGIAMVFTNMRHFRH